MGSDDFTYFYQGFVQPMHEYLALFAAEGNQHLDSSVVADARHSLYNMASLACAVIRFTDLAMNPSSEKHPNSYKSQVCCPLNGVNKGVNRRVGRALYGKMMYTMASKPSMGGGGGGGPGF